MAIDSARLSAAAAVASLLACLAACGAPVPSSSPGPPIPSGESSPTAPPAVGTIAPTSTASSSQSPSAPTPLGWQPLEDFPAEGAIEVASVTTWAGGFVAVGSAPAEGEDIFGLRQGVVWRSAHGRTWERSTDEVFANASLLHVVATADAAYVFGFYSICPLLTEGCDDAPDAGIAVWRSTDDAATAWERVPQPVEMREALLDGVATAHDSIIAYGSSGNDLSAGMWASSDGRDWESVGDLVGMDPVSAVVAGPSGFAAFGTRYVVESDTTRTVAGYSADGRELSSADISEELDAVIEDVAYGDQGFIAVGTQDDPRQGLSPVVLRSGDGMSWTPIEPSASFARTGFHAVHVLPDGFVVIGFARIGAEGEREQARTWQSSDGLIWHQALPLDGAYREFKSSAIAPTGVVAFAVDFEDEFDPAAASLIRAWYAPLPAAGSE